MKIFSFKTISISMSLLITFLLLIAVLSLFFVPKIGDIINALRSGEMIYSIKLSLITSLLSTFFVLIFSVPIAYALSRYDFFGKSILKTIINLPMAFPELVLGLSLLLLFSKTFVGDFFDELGIQIVFTKAGIVVAQFFTALPYGIRIIYSSFESVNKRYEYVSRSLGYGEFETFKNVLVPLIRNGIYASAIITFARSMGAFGAVLILAGGSYMKTEILPITLFLNISYGNMGMAITSGIVLIVISFVAILSVEYMEGKENVFKD
ncbi:ABC transporter permease [Lebetimonas sp. JH292]|uniref:ABC transporter permease n=1 Tax=Lebetimonas sp. JH292 TaxID=990068 RepID=UPI000465A3DA|nr:ABC transporter permease [Lebetimonas sp. JH292]